MAAAILITGANRGLGFEFASQYLAEGWRVFAACRNLDAASKLRCLAQDMLIVELGNHLWTKPSRACRILVAIARRHGDVPALEDPAFPKDRGSA